MSRPARVLSCLVLLTPLGADAAPLVPFFYMLGDLPGGSVVSQAYRVSGDGSTAVGRSASAAGFEAIRWTEAEGLVSIGDLPGGATDAFALAASADGSVIVGLGASAGSSPDEAFRWTQDGGMVGLGDLPGGVFQSNAWDVTADGSMVVGGSATAAGTEAWYWTQASGLVSIGDLPGGDTNAIARGVSSDGSVIAGDGYTAAGHRAFRWTQATGLAQLPLAPGATGATVRSISPDGSVVVGVSGMSGGGTEAWRWTEAGGTVLLGDLPGGAQSSGARDASLAGQMIVGSGWFGSNTGTSRATYWLDGGSIQTLDDLLAAWGLDLGGMVLSEALGVSDDGLVISGVGWLPGDTDAYSRAWIAGIPSFDPVPEPGALAVLGVGLIGLGRARRARSPA